jgi:ABC-type glycerol-3-phosphate transport system permease component
MMYKEGAEMENIKLNKRSTNPPEIALNILRAVIAIAITLVMLFPLFWMLISSFKTSDELLKPVPTLWPNIFRWQNYVDVLKMARFDLYFLNTIIMTGSFMVTQMLVGIFAAYGFSKGNFRFKNTLFIIVLGALMVPIQVTFVPIYVMVAKLNWINTFMGLIVPNAVSAYSIFMLRQSFMSVDNSYIEAAKVDGASRMRIIWHITIPSLLPTYFVLVMLNLANFLSNGMEQFYVFQNSFNKDTIQVLDLYVYNLAMGGGGYSLSTAISIFKSVVSIILLCVTNGVSKLIRGEGFI